MIRVEHFEDLVLLKQAAEEMFQNCPDERYKEIYTESPTHFHALLAFELDQFGVFPSWYTASL